MGYEKGMFAPGVKNPGDEVYRVGHHWLLAHARAWHLYDEKYRCTQNGKNNYRISLC